MDFRGGHYAPPFNSDLNAMTPGPHVCAVMTRKPRVTRISIFHVFTVFTNMPNSQP